MDRGTVTPEEEQQIQDLNSQNRETMNKLFLHFQALEEYRDQLNEDVRELEQRVAEARAASTGTPATASPQVRLGSVEMTEDDAVDLVAECVQFSQKYSSMK